jgi:hypothetical protein
LASEPCSAKPIAKPAAPKNGDERRHLNPKPCQRRDDGEDEDRDVCDLCHKPLERRRQLRVRQPSLHEPPYQTGAKIPDDQGGDGPEGLPTACNDPIQDPIPRDVNLLQRSLLMAAVVRGSPRGEKVPLGGKGSSGKTGVSARHGESGDRT